MQRIAIDVAVNRDGRNAHLLAGPDNTAGNLAAVGDQDLLELCEFPASSLSKVKVQNPKSFVLTGLWTSDIGLWTATS